MQVSIRRLAAALTMAMALAVPTAARAQNAPGGGRPSAERLRQMIEERFAAQIQTELALTDEQSARVRQILMASAQSRRAMEREDRAAQQALRDQLRPGVAAQTDSVTRLLDRLTTLRISFAQASQDEMHQLGSVLTPVQQAQFLLLRDRMMSRAQDVRMQRPPGGVSF